MNTNVSFRQMESSPALRDYATGKLEKIVAKYVPGKTDADVVMSVEKFWHIANFTVQIKNLTIKAQERSEDMYSSIDIALDKLEKQLRRHKDRLRDYKVSSSQSKTFRMNVLSPLDSDDGIDGTDGTMGESLTMTDEMDHYSRSEVEAAPAPPEMVETMGKEVRVLRHQDYTARAMTVQQAVIQLDVLQDQEFFVFTNDDSDTINVVFRRADGNIGLIET